MTANCDVSYRETGFTTALTFKGIWSFAPIIHWVSTKPSLIKIDVGSQTKRAHETASRGRLSSPKSERAVFFPSLHFFVSSLSLLLLLPFTAAHERLFLELTWLFKDVKFTLCHGFWGRKLLVCFLPPNLLFISFSVSSCCLSKALSLSPTHFLFLIYPCVSPSPLQSDLPPHTYTLLLIPPSLFLSLFYLFLLGKERNQSFSLLCHHLRHSASLRVEKAFKVAPHSLGYNFYILQ